MNNKSDIEKYYSTCSKVVKKVYNIVIGCFIYKWFSIEIHTIDDYVHFHDDLFYVNELRLIFYSYFEHPINEAVNWLKLASQRFICFQSTVNKNK